MIAEKVKTLAILGLTVWVVMLGISSYTYRKMNAASEYALEVQAKAIADQNAQATAKYAALKEHAERVSQELEDRARAQEKIDELAKDRNAAGDAAMRAAPVSVRYVTKSCGPSGGSTSGAKAATPKSGDDDVPTTLGVLPPAGARRLADTLKEIENLNAAYASCRATLLKE